MVKSLIISVSEIEKQKMNVLFKNGKCFFRDPENRVVAIEIEDDGQYELKVKSVNQ